MSLQNVWHHRKVAENSKKACWICYKPTASFLITPDNKDFFPICTGHLSDRGFCLPDAADARAVAALKMKEELDREIEKVKKEYEEKQKIKREKRKEKEKEKGNDKDKDKEAKKTEEEQDKHEEETKDDKIKKLSESKEADPGPRIFTLKKNFYQMRIDRIRNAEVAKRNRERLSNASNFPSPPTNNP